MNVKLTPYTIALYAFLLSIILFRLPYLYLIPGVYNSFLTTQSLARVLLMLSLIISLFILKKVLLFTKEGKHVNFLVLIFFAISSLSVISASNIESFIVRYKDFLIGILAFYIFYLFKTEERKVAFTLIITIPVMIIYQIILLYSQELSNFLTPMIYQKHFDILSYNLDRGRIYVDTFDEAFIPIIVLLLTKNRRSGFISYIFIVFISFLAFVANFRTRVGMLCLGLIGSLFVVKNKLVSKGILLILIVGSGLVMSLLASFSSGKIFFDRFLLSNQVEDVHTIQSRLDQITYGLHMGFVSPFGVGLGNYYDNLTKHESYMFKVHLEPAEISAREYIHNNFATVVAESGYIAFFIFTLLISKFFFMDIKIMRENNPYRRCFVIAFWTLFFYGLFNPPVPISYQVLFWGMRGLLS